MKRVNFERVAIQNFLSVGEEVVEINFKSGLHIITGINKDKPDRRNAIGKSTIADAVYFAITGETLREIKKDLIPNNLTSGNTHIELDFSVVDGDTKNSYKVVRNLSPSKAYILQNGVADITRDSISNSTKHICDILHVTPAILKNCIIMTVNNAVPFMAKSKTEKRKFIEDIFGMGVFSNMLSTCRSQYTEARRSFEMESTRLEELKNSLDQYKLQRDQLLSRRRDKHKIYEERKISNNQSIEDLTLEIEHLQHIDVSGAETTLSNLNSKLSACELKIDDYIEHVSLSKATINQKKDRYKEMGTGESVCPVCLRSIDENDIEHIAAERESLLADITALVDEIKDINIKLDNARDVKRKIQHAISKAREEISSAKIIDKQRESIQERIDQLERWQKELEEDISNTLETSTDFDDLIKESQKRVRSVRASVKSYQDELSKLDVVKYIVSEEGVKSYIVNKLLELLNSKLIHYLRKLDSNSICVFNEYFEEEILNEKNKICSYFNFSGAERKAIDLACLFAFSDIRRMQGGVSYNISLYDELLDSSLDERGIELVTEILQERVDEYNEGVYIISHRKESVKKASGDIIFLTKENGITSKVDYIDI